jgi:hypothetical protein
VFNQSSATMPIPRGSHVYFGSSSFVYDANTGSNQDGGETCDVRSALPTDESVQKLDQSIF